MTLDERLALAYGMLFTLAVPRMSSVSVEQRRKHFLQSRSHVHQVLAIVYRLELEREAERRKKSAFEAKLTEAILGVATVTEMYGKGLASKKDLEK